MTEPIIKWLNKKRSNSAGWGSTVDTLLATESLLKWSAKFGEDFQEIEGGVAMEVESRYVHITCFHEFRIFYLYSVLW